MIKTCLRYECNKSVDDRYHSFCTTVCAMRDWISCGIASNKELREFIKLMQEELEERLKDD